MGPNSMTYVLKRRGNLETQRDTRDARSQRKDHVRTRGGSGHLEAKDRYPRRHQHLDLGLPDSRAVRNKFLF